MRIFGLTITREKAVAGAYPVTQGSGGWYTLLRESFAGAWQRNVEVNVDSVLTYSTVFRAISLISSDIAKLRLRLMKKRRGDDIWEETENAAHSPVLRKPNRFQNRIQFYSNWVESKLIHGNVYVLKERDARRIVTRMYVLDPRRVTVLVAPDGSVFYELRNDDLAQIPEESTTVPASEIIHDRWNTIFHPLVGTSPIHAAGIAAMQGLRIQENSTKFFQAGSNPGGVLTAPGHINDDTAARLKDYWDKEYGAGGASVGKVAVLGDGLKFEPMALTASDSQLLEQLKWTAETVASVFGVPVHMLGIGQPPSYNNIEGLQMQYYSQCLQVLIESIEIALNEGLELPKGLGTEFDLDDLLRMDTATKVSAAKDAIDAGFLSPNEAREKFDLKPVEGGNSPYMQQQNFSLAALAKRDRDEPFSKPSGGATAAEGTEANGDGGDDEEARAFLADEFFRRSQAHYVARSDS